MPNIIITVDGVKLRREDEGEYTFIRPFESPLDIPCPRCSETHGKHCSAPTGRPLVVPHASRERAFLALPKLSIRGHYFMCFGVGGNSFEGYAEPNEQAVKVGCALFVAWLKATEEPIDNYARH